MTSSRGLDPAFICFAKAPSKRDRLRVMIWKYPCFRGNVRLEGRGAGLGKIIADTSEQASSGVASATRIPTERLYDMMSELQGSFFGAPDGLILSAVRIFGMRNEAVEELL